MKCMKMIRLCTLVVLLGTVWGLLLMMPLVLTLRLNLLDWIGESLLRTALAVTICVTVLSVLPSHLKR